MAVNGVSGHVMQVGAYRPDLLKAGQKAEEFDDRMIDNPAVLAKAGQLTATDAAGDDTEERRVPRELSKGRYLDIYG